MILLASLTETRKRLFVSVLSNALREVQYGYAARDLHWVSNEHKKNWAELEKLLKVDATVYPSKLVPSALEAVHLTVYYLGPEELSTITGLSLEDFISAGRLMMAAITKNIYTEVLWSEGESIDP